MNASKRKFNALLNNFGNKSTTSLPSSSGINKDSNTELAETQLKRRRINRPTSILGQAASPVESDSNFPLKTASIGYNKSLSLDHASPDTTDAPKYAPWDRGAFLKRLESFKSVTDWMPKPPKVNEVEWAKRGWVCQSRERVRCELCDVEIFVKLNIKELEGEEMKVLNASEIGTTLQTEITKNEANYGAEEALVEKYAQLIITSHTETCLWKQKGCDDTIFKLSLNHAPTTVHNIRLRYNALCAISERLPYMHNLHPPEEFDLNSVISYLPNDFLGTPMPDSESANPILQSTINNVALTMAIFGWTARPETKIRDGAAVCEVCFRTLGLWLFKSKEVNEAGEMIRPPTINYLDPVDQHREYCPWKSAKSQSAISSTQKAAPVPELAAWQIILRVLKNDHRLRETRDGASVLRSSLENRSQPGTVLEADDILDDVESVREEKDNERWARLRRVRSLFDTAPIKKLLKSSSAV